MKIVHASKSDVSLIHSLMRRAFSEYNQTDVPSSAMEETVFSVRAAMEDGEQGLIAYIADEPVGMIRFRIRDHDVYFYRLSVTPEKQERGIAKQLLRALEHVAVAHQKTAIICRVRTGVVRNIHLYQSLGYKVTGEETVYKPGGQTVKVAVMCKDLEKD